MTQSYFRKEEAAITNHFGIRARLGLKMLNGDSLQKTRIVIS